MTARPLDQNPVGNSCSRGTAALHLQSIPEEPPFILGFLGAHAPKRLFGYFLCAQKVTAGCGGAKPPLVSRHSAEPNDRSGGASTALGRVGPTRLRACLTSPRARLGGIFSALTALKILAIRQDSATGASSACAE